ncbi:hypothetical protein [Streptomyces niveus]|uniref:hypothetical protein n=1 Tax=Streptomyces niveus TaxID=193462 RepID=UPI0036D315FA
MSDSVPPPAAPATTEAPQTAQQETTVTAHFKMIFICVLVITLLAFVVFVLVGIFIKEPTKRAQNVSAICATISQMGFGAIFGLLGGVRSA